MLRAAGVGWVNMGILYGLPYQTRERMADSVQRVLSLSPDRVALYGYAHVPWMAKRQVMIPGDDLPAAEARLELFDTARELFLWDGYTEIGIDHYARPTDSMAKALENGTLSRNFQGYTHDPFDVLIGIGASAISGYPQDYAQNISTSAKYATTVDSGSLATERGHAMTADDQLRADMIEGLMCQFSIDLDKLSKLHGVPPSQRMAMTEGMRERFKDQIRVTGNRITLAEEARLIARLAAQEVDAYSMPEGRHSRAL